eukprot:TRINITY_DN15307_c0_g1_i1.p1 TRINITY_DN15307_c0_g1~~TRINITY_DN15307_c0_g1_i1.p1  ORF type:complete len:528 (-),score=52.60 TRINITY_DN15307_c0_g1_i1:29-1567(-)
MVVPGGSELVFSIMCVVVSSFTTTFGLFFQKLSLERTMWYSNQDEIARASVPRWFACRTRLYWIVGFLFITIFSFALDMYSMANLGQSMVVPLLASLEVAENQIFAPCVLGEKYSKVIDTLSALFCIIGALCTTLFGPGGPLSREGIPTFPEEYEDAKARFGELFREPVFICFEAVVVSLFLLSIFVSRMRQYNSLHFVSVGYAAGFLGGQQNLFLKGTGMCVVIGLEGDLSVFSDWLVYVFVGLMVLMAGTQLFVLNYGLANFDALLFVPTYTILYILSGTLVGLMFYEEYKLMSLLGWAMFGLGFVFIALAVTLLGQKSSGVPVENFEDPEPSFLSSRSEASSVHSAATGVSKKSRISGLLLEDETPRSARLSTLVLATGGGASVMSFRSATPTSTHKSDFSRHSTDSSDSEDASLRETAKSGFDFNVSDNLTLNSSVVAPALQSHLVQVVSPEEKLATDDKVPWKIGKVTFSDDKSSQEVAYSDDNTTSDDKNHAEPPFSDTASRETMT